MPVTKDIHTEKYWSRVDAVASLLLENDRWISAPRTAELIVVVTEKFSVSIRQAERYIAEARKLVKKIGKDKSQDAFIRAIRDREFLFGKAKGMGDIKLALEVARDRDKLFGLYEDVVTHKGEVSITFVEKLDE